jgi:hypothetical protein
MNKLLYPLTKHSVGTSVMMTMGNLAPVEYRAPASVRTRTLFVASFMKQLVTQGRRMQVYGTQRAAHVLSTAVAVEPELLGHNKEAQHHDPDDDG